jgi:hypothetical protein
MKEMNLTLMASTGDPSRMQALDLPVALLMLVGGLVCIALRKQQARARQKRVQEGELSPEEAKKKDTVFLWSSYGLVIIALFLLILWATGH